MAIQIPMVNPSTGAAVPAYMGLSISYLFFGPLVPLVRGHFIWALIGTLLAFTGVGHIWAAFVYNEKHKNYLIVQGYKERN